VYLEVPGDLESTALRDRFSGLEDQIMNLVDEFSVLEQVVTTQGPVIQTKALQKWSIHHAKEGYFIETHMLQIADIYATLIQFSKDNNATQCLYPIDQHTKPEWFVRNCSNFANIRLSHFTSLYLDGPINNEGDLCTSLDHDDDDDTQPDMLPPGLVSELITLYNHCLLYGALQPFDTLFRHVLLDNKELSQSPTLQLLYASILCHMLPHAYYWHRHIFAEHGIDETKCIALSKQYYSWAKRLLSSIYFDTPSLTVCHALCNLVLYHIENGDTGVVYIYSGMAVRMALTLQLNREDALDSVALHLASLFPKNYQPPVTVAKQYARSLLWFMYFLDTAASHYHDQPYEIHMDDNVSTTTYLKNPPLSSSGVEEHQAFFQYIEFHTCQITRDIRRTLFIRHEKKISYVSIERLEQRLLEFQKQLPPLDRNNSMSSTSSIWQARLYKQWIRHHGLWILIHQSFLPNPISIQRCTTAAFALVDLFDNWFTSIDCYFRPCVHELKQACEILMYHVEVSSSYKSKALEGLMHLVLVLLRTPVGEIAKTRPFVQRVLTALQSNV
jgi:hypothetical protein